MADARVRQADKFQFHKVFVDITKVKLMSHAVRLVDKKDAEEKFKEPFLAGSYGVSGQYISIAAPGTPGRSSLAEDVAAHEGHDSFCTDSLFEDGQVIVVDGQHRHHVLNLAEVMEKVGVRQPVHLYTRKSGEEMDTLDALFLGNVLNYEEGQVRKMTAMDHVYSALSHVKVFIPGKETFNEETLRLITEVTSGTLGNASKALGSLLTLHGLTSYGQTQTRQYATIVCACQRMEGAYSVLESLLSVPVDGGRKGVMKTLTLNRLTPLALWDGVQSLQQLQFRLKAIIAWIGLPKRNESRASQNVTMTSFVLSVDGLFAFFAKAMVENGKDFQEVLHMKTSLSDWPTVEDYLTGQFRLWTESNRANLVISKHGTLPYIVRNTPELSDVAEKITRPMRNTKRPDERTNSRSSCSQKSRYSPATCKMGEESDTSTSPKAKNRMPLGDLTFSSRKPLVLDPFMWLRSLGVRPPHRSFFTLTDADLEIVHENVFLHAHFAANGAKNVDNFGAGAVEGWFRSKRVELDEAGFVVFESFADDSLFADENNVEVVGAFRLDMTRERLKRLTRNRVKKFLLHFERSIPSPQHILQGRLSSTSVWSTIINEDDGRDGTVVGQARYTTTNFGLTWNLEQNKETAALVPARAELDVRILQIGKFLRLRYSSFDDLPVFPAASGQGDVAHPPSIYAPDTGGRFLATGPRCRTQVPHCDYTWYEEREEHSFEGLKHPGYFSIVTTSSPTPLWVARGSHRYIWQKAEMKKKIEEAMCMEKIIIPPWSIFFGRGDVTHAGAGYDEGIDADGSYNPLVRYHMYLVREDVPLLDAVGFQADLNPKPQK